MNCVAKNHSLINLLILTNLLKWNRIEDLTLRQKSREIYGTPIERRANVNIYTWSTENLRHGLRDGDVGGDRRVANNHRVRIINDRHAMQAPSHTIIHVAV